LDQHNILLMNVKQRVYIVGPPAGSFSDEKTYDYLFRPRFPGIKY
jgi:hypothetical protein